MTERRPLIVAEAGVNHNGDIGLAERLVDEAAAAGADYVKFQTFRTAELVTSWAPRAAYQEAGNIGGGTQAELLEGLELDEAAHIRLKDRCTANGIGFLSTPFDLASLRLLTELGVERIKIASGQITNGPFLLEVARTGKPVILSTGMSDLADVEAALGALAFAYLDSEDPGEEAFRTAWASPHGRDAVRRRVTLLHCTTEYPAPLEDVNLRAMATLHAAFGLPVGLSDHTEGIAIPIAAAALRAEVIEKHLTLDRNLPGPDHRASLEPDELGRMVAAVRQVAVAMGHPSKVPVPSELPNRAVARQSLVAARAIRTGEPFTAENVAIRRPGTGISPMRYWDLLKRLATRDYQVGEIL